MDVHKLREELLLEIERKESTIDENQKKIDFLHNRVRQLRCEQDGLKDDIRALNHRLNSLPIMINKLPYEMMSMIFKMLSLPELLTCARVCSRWYVIVSNLKIPSLVVNDSKSNAVECSRVPEHIFSWQCSIDVDRIRVDLCSYLEMQLPSQMLTNLAELKINIRDNRTLCQTDLGFINKMHKLKNLEIFHLVQRNNLKQISSITMKSLMIATSSSPVKLNTPFLTTFETMGCSLRNFEFAFPRSVRTLRLSKWSSRLAQFTELHTLHLEQDANMDLLTVLPKLQVLSFANKQEVFDSSSQAVKLTAMHLLEQKRLLNRENLSIRVFGVELDAAEQLDPCVYKGLVKRTVANCSCRDFPNMPNLIALHMKNWPKLASDLSWVNVVNYLSLVDCLDGNIRSVPSDFFQKFSRIRTVHVNGEADENELIEFLAECKHLDELKVEHSKFDQSFYLKFASCFPFIEWLSVSCNLKPITDYRFIEQFHNPTYLSFDDCVPVEIVCRSLEKFTGIRDFMFKIRDKRACVTRMLTGFKLSIDIPSYPRSFERLDDLLYVLKRIKNYFLQP